MVRELADQGLEAIETIHSGHDDETVARLTRLADRLDLLTTGGSDFHGSSKPGIKIGRPSGREVPREFFDRIAVARRGTRQVPREDSARDLVVTAAASRSAPGPR
jgi:hypothetical protein